MQTDTESQTYLAFAGELADAARASILPHFRTETTIEAKPGRLFDPVTAADKAAKAVMRTLIEARPPTTKWKNEAILSRISVLNRTASIASAHHERLDGKGYPLGLAGDAIPLETRIVTVADFFDALCANRPYRDAMPIEDALAIMAGEVTTAVDPDWGHVRHCAARRHSTATPCV